MILSKYSEFGVTSVHISDCYNEERRVRHELFPFPLGLFLNLLIDLKNFLKKLLNLRLYVT
jgi:hypothetical protein